MQLAGCFRGVDTLWRQVKIDHRRYLPYLPSGSYVPKAGVMRWLVTQLLKPPEPTDQHVMGNCH